LGLSPNILLHSASRISPLQFILLIQLETSPKYGYELLKTIKEEFGDSWDLKTGTLYPALKSLEKQRFVLIQKKDDVDFYYITQLGIDFLHRFGNPQQHILNFGVKYFIAVSKWMSPVLKQDILTNVVNISREEINFYNATLALLTDNIPIEARLSVLKTMHENMSKRLDNINFLISNIERTKNDSDN